MTAAPDASGPDLAAPDAPPAGKAAREPAEKPADKSADKPATKAPEKPEKAAEKPAAKAEAPEAKPEPKPEPKPVAKSVPKPVPAPDPAARISAAASATSSAASSRARKAADQAARAAEARLVAQAAGAAAEIRTAGAVANAARMRRRHWNIVASFVLVVLLPFVAAAWYLWARAADQYASHVSFSVRSGETRSAGSDLLGRLSQFSGPNSTDTDILYQFIQSQDLVVRIDRQLDLRMMYSRHRATDPLFSFHPDGTIEDLVLYWQRMVRIAYDAGTGLMGLRVLAFDPDEAQRIAQLISDESTTRINALSAEARRDATRYAREELDLALERLRNAREAVTAFRSRTQIVDPSADIQGQMGLLNTLQGQLASALIDLDLLRETTREGDPRIAQLERRIEVIRIRIADERSRFGVGGDGPGGEDYATLVGEFERLNVDREFAEQAYRSALMGYDAAVAEAERTSRYLATHIAPTLAESSRYPERLVLLSVLGLFLLLVWSVGVLVYYSIRDRR